ncbi:MAG: ATP-dependent DNA helicase [Chitinophagaceae bacterium]|nr:MAG: ATP-dependent DNA helicase [Chitinophagaceae bacterium]
MDYLEELNEPQREAVLYTEGPLMIIAGAGSGKTKVLTTRIAHLMAKGVDAFTILALTFTNKAAREMKERVEKILSGNGSSAAGREVRNLYIGTFHSVFARILRTEASHLGFPNNFTIYDTDDSKSLIKTIVREQNLDEKIYKSNYVLNRISAAKNSLVGWEEYAQDFHARNDDQHANRPLIYKLYEVYVKRCFRNGAMDFDDLLFNMHKLLTSFPEVLHKYQHKFKYILIDEYQDTNPAQYAIIKLLGAVYENICVVGDDAQSIYSFRGATIQNILQFEKDYDDVRVVKLEQNYRSTKSILKVANEVIANNKLQIQKVLWTDNTPGEKIILMRTMSDNDEGRFVADIIAEQKLRNHYHEKDFAILYRTNAQSRSFEENLRRKNIPYRIYGGLSFYQRKEIKDIVAYLRLIVNTRDEEALRRIINYPVRGIGKTSLEKASLIANQHQITLWQVLEQAAMFGFRAGTLNAIENFVIMIKSFQIMLEKHTAYEVAFRVGKETGIIKELFNDKSTEGVARYENIQELLNSIKEFTETPDEEGELADKGLGSYLQQITLLTDADKGDEDSDVVRLMTIHAAKGLEFPCVFVVGLEETLFPNAMSVNDREDLEEERRLFYVAVTRAKTKLWLTYANTRYRFGNLVQNDPSRFLDEIPKAYLEESFVGRSAAGAGYQPAWERPYMSQRDTQAKASVSGMASAKVTPTKVIVDHTPSAGFKPDDPSTFEAGMEVEHQKFGFGKILKLEGNSGNRIATVFFHKAGEKKIMLNYARLQVVKKEIG